MSLDLPLDAIEGIGPATAASFRTAGYERVGDLLRSTTAVLHAVVGPLASHDEIVGWQDAAWLLEVDGMTPQWAEALVAGGVDSVDAIQDAAWDDLVALFRDARARGAIPDEPDAPTMFRIGKDAVALASGGVVAFDVTDASGAPVAGAEVRVTTTTVRTDPRGRCRVARLRGAPTHPASVTAGGYATWSVSDVEIGSGPRALVQQRVQLAAATSAAPSPVLDEFTGDVLPTPRGELTIFDETPVEALRDRETLRVRALDSVRGEATVVSVFRSYRDGAFRAVRVRIPRADLPPGVKIDDVFHRRGGVFTAGVRGFAAALEYRERRRAEALLERESAPLPGGVEGVNLAVTLYLDALKRSRTVRRKEEAS